MTAINVNDVAAPDGESFKFNEVGDTAKGVISHVEQIERTNSFNQLTEKVLVISMEDDAGDTLKIWPVTNTNVNGDGYASRMARAVAAAVRAAGTDQLEIGGTLAVKYSESIPTDKGNPAKGFVAQYKPPAATADDDTAGSVTDLID